MKTNIEKLHEVRERLMTWGSRERRIGKTTYHCHVVAGMLQVLEPGSVIYVVMEWQDRFRHFQKMLIDIIHELRIGQEGMVDVRRDSIWFRDICVGVKFVTPDNRNAYRGCARDTILVIDVENMPARFYNKIYTVEDAREVMEVVRRARAYHTQSCIDPHTEKAAEMFGVPYTEVTAEMRKRGKIANYIDAYTIFSK